MRTANPLPYIIPIAMVITACTANPSPGPIPALSCPGGDTVLVRETLYFGRNRPGGGTVSDAEWQRFLAEVVTPRFPSGLTVQEASGQWQGAGGAVEQERSEIVTLYHPDTEASRRSIHEIALEYKRRFQQEAVLRERAPTCARFE
jgi:Protein of unknown function (DUF3574)